MAQSAEKNLLVFMECSLFFYFNLARQGFSCKIEIPAVNTGKYLSGKTSALRINFARLNFLATRTII
jgi:hypothetical protein